MGLHKRTDAAGRVHLLIDGTVEAFGVRKEFTEGERELYDRILIPTSVYSLLYPSIPSPSGRVDVGEWFGEEAVHFAAWELANRDPKIMNDPSDSYGDDELWTS